MYSTTQNDEIVANKEFYDKSIRSADGMESQVESAKFLVNAFIQNPVQIKSNEFVAIGVRHRHSMSVFH